MGTVSNYEIAFVTEPITDPADERLEHASSLIPILAVAYHGDLTLITTLVNAANAVEAGVAAARAIDASGIRVQRTYQDLVSRQDVADRLNVTRQAVGNWVRGDRHDETPFPAPASLVAGGAWLWGDVAAWARSQGYDLGDADYPTLKDHARLDLLIANHIQSVTVSTVVESGDIAFRGPSAPARQEGMYQTYYALAS
jgi:hypothetical protein